jgi:hypothetical protein
MLTDGSGQNDGWYVDDVSLAENALTAVSYPFYENFENGLDHWFHASWTVDTNGAFAGNYSVHDTVPTRMPPDTQLYLTLAGELKLTNAVNPQLTYWVRGHLTYRSYFRAQVSTNSGLNWMDLTALNLNYDWSSDWVRQQVSLAAYTNQSVRLRFLSYNTVGSAPDQDIFLDNVGIGEPSPGAPTLSAPVQLSSVSVVRPTLVVTNALDYQGDPLFYRFEAYADAGLSNLVAQVPSVASGADLTAWQVDVNLPNNAQYWWRCRATDGTNSGPWMATATFFVNEINHPPFAPQIAGPPPMTVVTNLDALLFWFATTDPDEGDSVATYQIQVAATADFLAPIINATNIPAVALPPDGTWAMALPLSVLPGSENLVLGRPYHWRVCAQDLRGLSSDWSPGMNTFHFGAIPPQGGEITGLRLGTNGQLTLEWTGTVGSVFVEFSETLNATQWQTVAGPLVETSWTFTPTPGTPSGFYRLRCE